MLEEFKKIGRCLFQEGLVGSHGGNLSIRRGDRIFITRRDAMLGELKEGDIVEVGIEPGSNEEAAAEEIPSHRAIYRETKAEAIIHAHPPNAIAVSITDNKIIPQDSEGMRSFRSAAIVRAHQAVGSDEVARLITSFMQPPNVIAVVKAHGSFSTGKNLEEAYRYTSALEDSCRVLVAIRASGGQRPPAPREKPREMRRSAIPPGIGVMDRSRYNKR
ncbi:MAG: class II aldolase/adducin family protein [Candidatus Margulisiibacteriota bacterium]